MAANAVDSVRLAKLLALAESDVDGEALAALRKAAGTLSASGMRLRDLTLVPDGSSTEISVGEVRARLERAEARLARLEDDLDRARADQDKAERARDRVEEEAEALRQAHQSIERNFNSAEVARDHAESTSQALREQLERAQARVAYLESLDPDATLGDLEREQGDRPDQGRTSGEGYMNAHERPEFADWRVAREEGVTPQFVRSRRRDIAV